MHSTRICPLQVGQISNSQVHIGVVSRYNSRRVFMAFPFLQKIGVTARVFYYIMIKHPGKLYYATVLLHE